MKLFINKFFAGLFFAIFLMTFFSCKDDYIYDNEEPNFLGSSIYDYLKENGNFTYFVKLIDDLDYSSVLSKTGSKTLFPAMDNAFNSFFQSNPYGVSSYNQLTPAQKRSIVNSSMINMAYLSNMLSNISNTSSTDGAGEGLALRRATAYAYLDSITYLDSSNALLQDPYWKRFSRKGIYLVDDETSPYMVHFTPNHTSANGLTNSDVSLALGQNYDNTVTYVNGIPVVQTNIVCKNGYVHVLENVLTPAKNMAQIIETNGSTKEFAKLMDLFCAPYYNSSVSNQVHSYYNGSTVMRPLISDSVFVRHFFTSSNSIDPNGNSVSNYGLLYIDPSNNSYASMQDMGVMFVPTDEAMNSYINGSKGQYLKDEYGSWYNIPSNLLALFIKNHQKKSYMSSLPHTWATMTDEASFAMNVSTSDIVKSYIGCNGVVYVTNKVYPPIDYQCVYASVLTSDKTKIMNWAIQNQDLKFYLYLRSMENMYNLLVPTDDAMKNYQDPISWAKGRSYREIWAFSYDETLDNPVTADVYSVDDSGNKSSFKKKITDQSIIKNRLNDIVDRHIIVGTMTNGAMSNYIDDGTKQFVLTKGGSTLKITGSGDSFGVQGGGNIEEGDSPSSLVINSSTNLLSRYDSNNGRTYFINKIAQDPTSSVYNALSENDDYKAFFDLLNGNSQVFTYFQDDPDISPIFSLNKMSSTSGLGYIVNFFNNFRYTIFVPTKAALEKAFSDDSNLYTWDEIAADDNYQTKRAKTIYLLNFLKYHFMDNSIYLSNESFSASNYESAARNSSGKFCKLTVSSDGTNFTIKSIGKNENGTAVTAHIVKTDGSYNVMTRDFVVNNSDYKSATQIISSSRAVIHLIDTALKPE